MRIGKTAKDAVLWGTFERPQQRDMAAREDDDRQPTG